MIRPLIPLDVFRLQVLRRDTASRSFRESWPSWRPRLERHLEANPTGHGLYDLGEHLREAFRQRTGTGRSQSDLAVSGAAFEALMSWYLNLLLWGTPVIAAKSRVDNVPLAVRNATTIMMGTVKSNSETDLVLFNVPGSDHPDCDLLSSVDRVNLLLERHVKDTSVLVLQTKTNWRDNAQIPMLWDWIYDVKEFTSRNITVGIRGFSPRSFKRFAYAFATVPTGSFDSDAFSPEKLHVRRVRQLSGRNYWCAPTSEDVALCINELPHTNFAEELAGTPAGHHVGHLEYVLEREPDLIRSFLNCEFPGSASV